jgi:acetate kinase
MCVIRAGRSVDSTMGFTALDGLLMGTRCGQLDPGVVLYLLNQRGWSAKDVERLVYHDAGLRGLSGVSNDVRDLLASRAPGARVALDYFVYRIGRELGSLTAALGGLDALVLTAGIGKIRPRSARGSALARRGSASGWTRRPTTAERMIAEHTLSVVSGTA